MVTPSVGFDISRCFDLGWVWTVVQHPLCAWTSPCLHPTCLVALNTQCHQAVWKVARTISTLPVSCSLRLHAVNLLMACSSWTEISPDVVPFTFTHMFLHAFVHASCCSL